MLVKCKNLLKYILFGWLLLKYLLLEFVSSIISSYVTTELPIILLHIYHFCNYILHDSKHNRFLTFNFFFFYFYIYSDAYCYSHFWFDLHFLLSNLHTHLHDIYFANVFDSLIFVTILKTRKFKSFISFETNTLLHRLSRVLQLPTHLFRLTANR